MTRARLWRRIMAALQPPGREHAISVSVLARKVRDRFTYGAKPMVSSTMRGHLHRMQAAGLPVLTSPRAGVWIAANEDERLDVIDELRASVTALEKRMSTINQGRCALRSCRRDLPEATIRRGGLYCCPNHRYKAAVARSAS